MSIATNIDGYRGGWRGTNGYDQTAGTGEVIAQTPLSTAAEVDQAGSAAAEACREWSATSVVARTDALFRFRGLLADHLEELAALVTMENGKDLQDARGEARRGLEMVDFACGMPTLLMGETVRNVSVGVDTVSYRFPLGVVAAITPFNFPMMVPLWTLPLATGAGNAYILKPSERTPLSSLWLADLLREAGLPAGVVSVVHGSAVCWWPGARSRILWSRP